MLISEVDKLVKSLRLRHSRAGGNPERVEIIGSKSPLISRLHGNDGKLATCGFYDAIKKEFCKGSHISEQALN